MRPGSTLAIILLIFFSSWSQSGCLLKKKPAASIPSPPVPASAIPTVSVPAPPVINFPAPAPTVQRTFARQAVEIRYSADEMLNAFDNRAHTLLVVVYQLADANPFSQLAKSEEGVKKLLQAASFDPSVAGFDQFVAQPGEARVIKLDRAENARWVAIVAGYYDLLPQVVSRLISIPVKVEKQGNQEVAAAGRVQIHLYLGPHSLEQLDPDHEVF